MARSLLPPEAVHVLDLPAASKAAATVLWPDWPQGTPQARLVHEYLCGRAAGVLDVSGRALGTAAEATAQSAPGTGSNRTAWTELPLLVIDDEEDGALLMACHAVTPSGLLAYNDDLRADAAQNRFIAALPAEAEPPAVHATGTPEPFALTGRDEPVQATDPAPGTLHLAGLPGADGTRPRQYRTVLSAPKAAAALQEYLHHLVPVSEEIVVVGRDKHMSRALNAALAEYYGEVHVSPGLAKSRLIVATGRRPVEQWPRTPGFPQRARRTSDLEQVPEIEIAAHGACFGGTRIDRGAELLLGALLEHGVAGGRVLDLGCGNGWLLTALAHATGVQEVWGLDVSKAATASAWATWEYNAVRPAERGRLRELAAPGREAGSFDLVLLNPPFHSGTDVTTDAAHEMIDTAHRMLAPGGRLVLVHNSHLRYRSHLNHLFADVEQWARDPRFTVLTGTRPTTGPVS